MGVWCPGDPGPGSDVSENISRIFVGSSARVSCAFVRALRAPFVFLFLCVGSIVFPPSLTCVCPLENARMGLGSLMCQ